uniref:Uncharacterized protein n=1 Tax=Columba livia TaxID=8932 RepID=R7VV11_COLLI
MAYLAMFPARSRGCKSCSRPLRRIPVASCFDAAGNAKRQHGDSEVAATAVRSHRAPHRPFLSQLHPGTWIIWISRAAPAPQEPHRAPGGRTGSVSHREYPLRSPCISSSTIIARSRFFYFFFPYFFYFYLFFF